MSGSSPRLRGTPPRGTRVSRTLRFIPASAGNTRPVAGWAVARTVHPRVCGEHSQLFYDFQSNNGSSPRLRGTHGFSFQDSPMMRFIPASAGNTPFGVIEVWLNAVHPRVCGEHGCTARVAPGGAGSSPRLRGTPARARTPRPRGRFIPASAGNTCQYG